MSTRIIQEKGRPTIQRLEHTDFGSGKPYRDDELNMSQSEEHRIATQYLCYCFQLITKNLGLSYLSDNPVWYLLPKPKKGKIQKAYYPDLCVSKNPDNSSAIASDMLLSLEVVSVERRRKEVKDRIYMKGLNQYNGVPEFVLIYPRASDNRVIEYYTFDGYGYVPLLPEDGKYKSRLIKGLSLREIPRDDWRDGAKVEVLYNDRVLVEYEELWDLLEQERHEKEQERREKEQALKREKEALEKVKQLEAKLKELGF